MKRKSIGIIGGGASGLFCGITLKRACPELNITIYEKEEKLGKKILQTGNGMCNISNTSITKERPYQDYNTPWVRDAISKFDYQTLNNELKKLGIITREDSSGRVYPYSRKASTVLNRLLKEVEKLNINIKTGKTISAIKPCDDFSIYTDELELYHEDYLVMATGGNSSINYKNLGYGMLETMGHSIVKTTPILGPIKTKEKTISLNGIRVKAGLKVLNNEMEVFQTKGEIQFKKDGLSGIAIFEATRYVEKNSRIVLDLMSEYSYNELKLLIKELYKDSYLNVLLGIFPKMVALDIIKRCKEESIDEVCETIKNYSFTVLETYGFKFSQVTRGGVSTKEVDPFNFESLIVPKLYILGEVLDVDGNCGGYNLHFAFASAYSATQNLIKEIGRKKK